MKKAEEVRNLLYPEKELKGVETEQELAEQWQGAVQEVAQKRQE